MEEEDIVTDFSKDVRSWFDPVVGNSYDGNEVRFIPVSPKVKDSLGVLINAERRDADMAVGKLLLDTIPMRERAFWTTMKQRKRDNQAMISLLNSITTQNKQDARNLISNIQKLAKVIIGKHAWEKPSFGALISGED